MSTIGAQFTHRFDNRCLQMELNLLVGLTINVYKLELKLLVGLTIDVYKLELNLLIAQFSS